MVVAPVKRMTAFALVLGAVACGGGAARQATPSAISPVSLEYDRGAGVVVIEADTYGGLMPPPTGRHVPELSIYGDGFVVLARDDGKFTVGTDRAVATGHLSEEELTQLVISIADSGFLQLGERYMPSPATPDLPWRHVTVNLLDTSKTVSIYPFDFSEAPQPFWEVYDALMDVHPSDAAIFTPLSGTLTATDLGPIGDLPGGQQSQVAPWDTPLVGVALPEATEGSRLEGEQYQVVEEFLVRYPAGQMFGSQEGRAYQVLLEADLPWEESSPQP